MRSRPAPATIDLAYRRVPTLVLGASGFIGAWTARALLARGADVTAVGRDPARLAAAMGSAASQVRTLTADLGRPGAVAELMAAAAPAITFNLAGYGVDRSERDPHLMDALNARLVADLCERLAAAPGGDWRGLSLVHAGSALEYGRIEGPLDEAVEPRPVSDYGRTKLAGTRHVQQAGATGVRAVVSRLFTVYGPGEHAGRLLPSLLDTARTGAPLALTSGRQRRDFTYVADAVEGLLRLGASGARPGEVVNVATGRLTPVREFAETAARVIRFDPGLLAFGTRPDLDDEMWHGDVDVSRLRRLTSWSPATSIADGIRQSWEAAG